MREVTCEQCEARAPMNGTFRVFDRTLCEACAKEELERRQEEIIPDGEVVRRVDPTICKQCGADQGDQELPLRWGHPLCEPCYGYFRRRPFPRWFKAAAVGLLALVAVSFAYNWRFLEGYTEFVQATRALKAGDPGRASALMNAASRHVPESKEFAEAAKQLAVMADFKKAVGLLQADSSAEALSILRACRGGMPAENQPVADRLIMQAEMGVAFDRKDYTTFLEKAKAMLALEPDDARVLASVASAYACQYAVTGDEQYKRESVDFLGKARSRVDRGDGGLPDYVTRIEHRLDTREIISSEEFKRRFPQGWRREEGRS